jgi:glycosyltransferase involved in cell wall biosynthesis
MVFHIIMGREIDLARVNRDAAAGKCPRHVLGLVADALDARIHWPRDEAVSLMDKVKAKFLGSSPEHWALARRLRGELAAGDVVYCTGEDVGIPVAATCGGSGKVRVVCIFHNIDRPRGRLAFLLLGLKSRVDSCLVIAHPQADFLARAVGSEKVRIIDDNTDVDFFCPGPALVEKARPIIVSVGLEKRDYRALAAATVDLDVDVRISGFSSDAAPIARAFPEVMPDNMDRRFYEWPDLRQLYREADIVVVSVAPNSYAAGVQGLMEGMASGRPVVASATQGMATYLATVPVASFPPGDAKALREAIVALLADPDEAARKGVAGRATVLERHTPKRYADAIVQVMRELASPAQ